MPYDSYQRSTGAVEVWVAPNLGGSRVPLFLGFAEYHPVNQSEHNWQPVFSDQGGPVTPFDKEFQGATEEVVIDFNKFNDDVFDLIEAEPRPANNFVGATSRLDRGSLLIANNLYFVMWLRFTFFGTINSPSDASPGWCFYCCNVAGVHTPKQGTKTLVKRLVVECNNLYDPATKGFLLKSNTAAAFAPIAGLVSA